MWFMYCLLHAGRIPVGYRYQAKSHSESTHEIPIEDFEYAEKDYRRILRELEHFVESSDEKEIPPVFSKVFIVPLQSLLHTHARARTHAHAHAHAHTHTHMPL